MLIIWTRFQIKHLEQDQKLNFEYFILEMIFRNASEINIR